MNKIFKVIFNQSTQTWTVVSELAKSATKVKSQSLAITLFVLSTLYSEMAWGDEIFKNVEGSGDKNNNIVAWGTDSSASAGAVALGHQARANIREGIAIGYNSSIRGNHTMSIGSNSSVANDRALAIGYKASVSAIDGVALGSHSVTTRFSLNNRGISHDKINVNPNNRVGSVWAPRGVNSNDIKATIENTKGAVSVGDATNGAGKGSNKFTRQIINVAAGSADSDAANVAQLRAVASILRKYQGDDNQVVSLNLGGTLKIIGGNTTGMQGTTKNYKNIQTKKNNSGIEIVLNKDIKVNSIQSHTATIGNTLSVGNNNAVSITATGIIAPKITFGSGQNSTNAPFFQANGNDIKLGLDNSNTAVKLTNLAEGDISQSSTDAVTGKQLHEVKEEIKQYKANPPGTGFKVSDGNNHSDTQKLGGDKTLTVKGEDNITTELKQANTGSTTIKVKLNKELKGLENVETEGLTVSGQANFESEAIFEQDITVEGSVDAEAVNAQEGTINKLNAPTLRSENATIKQLTVTDSITTNKLKAADGNITHLIAQKANINHLTSSLIKSDVVQTDALSSKEIRTEGLAATKEIQAKGGVNLGQNTQGEAMAGNTKAISGGKVYNFVTQQVANAGFNIQKGGMQVNKVLNNSTVNFLAGDLTTVSVTKNDTKTDIKYDIIAQTISSSADGKAELAGAGTGSKGVAKAVDVVVAINKAGFFLKADGDVKGEHIKNGESITVKQGNNIVVERQDSRITVKTVDSPVFKDITADSLTTSQLEAEEAKIVNAEIDDVDVNTLTVNEKANITKLNVSDSANFEGKLTAKTAQVSDNLTVNGKTITNELEVKKGAKIKGGLKSDTVTTDFLNVSRLANLADTVTKDLITRGTAEFKGPATFRKAVQFDRNINVNGSINAQTVNVADLLNAAKAKIVTAEITYLTTKAILTAEKGVLLNTDGSGSGDVAANDHKAVSGDKVYNFVTQQVNNAGFKIDEKGVQKADITSGKVVNFVDGDLTTVSVTQNNGKTEVKYSVVTQEIGSDNQGKAQLQGNRADSKGVAKAVEVVEAVNNASIFLKANEENTGGRVKNGESITVKQGNNIVVERQNSRITVKTVDNPTFKDITTDSLTTSQLETDEARISNAEIDDADINTLTVNEKANISNLTANTAEISEKLTAKTLEVQEKTTLKGEVTAKKGLTVEGDTTFKGKVVFDGEVEIKKMVQDTTTASANITEKLTTKDFEASGNATFKDHVDLQAGATVGGELNVDDVVATGTINANGIKAATADLTQLTVNEKIEAKKGIDLGTGSGEIKDNEKKAVSGEVVARTIKEIKEAGFKVKANGQEHTVKLGETVEFKAGNELTVEQKDGVITYGLTKQIKEAIEAAQKLTNSGVVGGSTKDQTGKEVEGATANGKGSQATGKDSTATGTNAQATGTQSTASGQGAVANNANTTATGQNAQATGNNATASGAGAKATGKDSTATGTNAQATGTQSTASGQGAVANNANTTATGQNAQATGNNATASGAGAKATGKDSTATGTNAQATGTQSTASGQGAVANNANTTATGQNAQATGNNATASGAGAKATGKDSTATGTNAQATGTQSTASGQGAVANNANTTATGQNAQATGNNATASGAGAKATGKDSTATGTNAQATGTQSTASGQGAVANNANTTATGQNAQATGKDSTATGTNAQATGTQSTASGQGAVANNANTTATGQNAQATGNNATASGAGAKATGKDSTATGTNAQATGTQSTASGQGAVANNANTTATGQNAQATGNNATASGAGAKATGKDSTATGTNAQATGTQSTASGQGAVASGNDSTATGQNAQATADGATASGADSQATAQNASAFGQSTRAVGDNATTMGYRAYVAGKDSTALGANTEVTHNSSVALGSRSITTRDNEVSIGSLNAPRLLANVKDGVLDTDAVNVRQLNKVSGQLGQRINALTQMMERNSLEHRAAIAGANAAIGLPQVYLPGKSMMAVAFGTHKGQNAIAVGYSASSDNGKLVFKLQGNANTQKDLSGSVGLGYQW